MVHRTNDLCSKRKIPIVHPDAIRIKVFGTWANNIQIYDKIMAEYDWECDDKYGLEYVFTSDDDYTHAILMNITMSDRFIKKENIIGLAQEPALYLCKNLNSKIIEFYKNSIKRYFIGTTKYINSAENNFIEGNAYLFPHISYKQVNTYIKNYPKKTKLINYVYSFQTSCDSRILYNYRHSLGNSILEQKLPIDFYGSSTNKLKKIFPGNKNIHSEFAWKDVHEIYENYKFSIVIENTREEEYFTEKIIIPLLCGCTPIYLGCRHIDSYFKDYVIHLNGDINDDMALLRDILNKPDKYYKKIAIQEIKEKIHLKNIIHQEFL